MPGKERLVLLIRSCQPKEGEQEHLQKLLSLSPLKLHPLKLLPLKPLPEPTEDGALNNRPISHREQVATAIEVANLRRERDEARRERDEARRECDATLQNWSKE